VPFVVILAFAPHTDLHAIASFLSNIGSALSIATFAYIMRSVFFNMSSPIASAFAMEQLDPGERGATIGIQSAVASLVAAVGGAMGGWWMAAHDFQTPLLLMAGLYFISTGLFLYFFRNVEQPAPRVVATASAGAGR